LRFKFGEINVYADYCAKVGGAAAGSESFAFPYTKSALQYAPVVRKRTGTAEMAASGLFVA
jgi:hypothetical protein